MNVIRSYLDKALEWFLVALMVLLLGDVLLQVASRYVLANTISFTDELAGFLLIWVGMAGAAYLTGQGQHLAITFIKDKAKPSNQKWLDIAIQLSILIFAIGVLIIGGIWLVYTRFFLGQVSASMEISLGYIYMIVPISGLLIAFYSIGNILEKVKEHDGN
ncbi:MAG: TRAP transporter small permease [Flavobacteriales bacterium]|nr:TRAP transporter small permease [Flavobacteriales bacterium]